MESLDNIENKLIKCRVCHIPKNNIKEYKLFNSVVFIGIAILHRSATHTCCAQCMRKLIIKKTFNISILTAWILWPIMPFLFHFIVFLISFTKGHSKKVIELEKLMIKIQKQKETN
jgi:phosphate/sulfate permease